jgi:hypothetical protein
LPKISRDIDLIKIAYTELNFSIDANTSNMKDVFNTVKGCKSEEYPNVNTANTLEKAKE